jgi:uncharacterized protein (DUF1778 family)
MKTDKKTSRIEIRLTQDEKDIIVNAAKSLGQDVSSFILGSILPKAKEILMDESKWIKFKEDKETVSEG